MTRHPNTKTDRPLPGGYTRRGRADWERTDGVWVVWGRVIGWPCGSG